jgi:hypothetical protein
MSKLSVTQRVLTSALWIAVATCFVMLSARTASADQDHKIKICHKGQTIEVDVHAVPAHLDHGDVLGDCGGTPGCGPPCTLIFDPVVCADGKTYANQCFADCAGAPGPCGRLGICSNIFDPVLCNGVLYANECVARNAGCTGPITKACACPQIYAPVRCSDGTIYINSCVAACQGASGCVEVTAP